MGFGKDGKGVIIRDDPTEALGTLGAKDVIVVVTGKTQITTHFRMIKTEV